ncbi:MAG: hypothetical protein ACFB0C_12245 [Leptolyngbyaceae cyanobacterium]
MKMSNTNIQTSALGQVSRLKIQHDRQRSQQRQKSMLMRTLADVGIE